MPAGFQDAPEVTLRMAVASEHEARDAVARLRMGLVVRPRSAAQVGEAAARTVAANNDVGKVNRPAAVAVAANDRRNDRLNWAVAALSPLDIRQTTDERDIRRIEF